VKPGDYLGFLAFASFGLWWVLFPKSVIAFYTWFGGGKTKISHVPEFAVRVSGFVWVVLVLCVMAHYLVYGK
jgi:succinate-acetate transporter protein